MTWGVLLAAFVITALGVVFSAVPTYCLVWASDLVGRLDRRASYKERTVAAPFSPREPSRDVNENVCVLRFPGRSVPSQIDHAALAEERLDQLAS